MKTIEIKLPLVLLNYRCRFCKINIVLGRFFEAIFRTSVISYDKEYNAKRRKNLIMRERRLVTTV